jgi:hypothetical protein
MNMEMEIYHTYSKQVAILYVRLGTTNSKQP